MKHYIKNFNTFINEQFDDSLDDNFDDFKIGEVGDIHAYKFYANDQDAAIDFIQSDFPRTRWEITRKNNDMWHRYIKKNDALLIVIDDSKDYPNNIVSNVVRSDGTLFFEDSVINGAGQYLPIDSFLPNLEKLGITLDNKLKHKIRKSDRDAESAARSDMNKHYRKGGDSNSDNSEKWPNYNIPNDYFKDDSQ